MEPVCTPRRRPGGARGGRRAGPDRRRPGRPGAVPAARRPGQRRRGRLRGPDPRAVARDPAGCWPRSRGPGRSAGGGPRRRRRRAGQPGRDALRPPRRDQARPPAGPGLALRPPGDRCPRRPGPPGLPSTCAPSRRRSRTKSPSRWCRPSGCPTAYQGPAPAHEHAHRGHGPGRRRAWGAGGLLPGGAAFQPRHPGPVRAAVGPGGPDRGPWGRHAGDARARGPRSLPRPARPAARRVGRDPDRPAPTSPWWPGTAATTARRATAGSTSSSPTTATWSSGPPSPCSTASPRRADAQPRSS
jgi:hypothetical protein